MSDISDQAEKGDHPPPSGPPLPISDSGAEDQMSEQPRNTIETDVEDVDRNAATETERTRVGAPEEIPDAFTVSSASGYAGEDMPIAATASPTAEEEEVNQAQNAETSDDRPIDTNEPPSQHELPEDVPLAEAETDHQQHTGVSLEDDEEGFDPATLANLAALSRIVNEDDEDGDQELHGEGDGQRVRHGTPDRQRGEEGEDALETNSPRHDGPLTSEQVREFVNNLSHAREEHRDREAGDGDGDDGRTDQRGEGERQEGGRLLPDGDYKNEDQDEDEDDNKLKKMEDEDYDEEDQAMEKGKRRRKRNRTVLSCTECHRRCDRNIPCSRCIKRGVPGMCRMEHPVLPQRKRRKVVEDEDINYELGIRVQALESLLRSGSLMDADQASAAARETIMHATRAANAGSQDANNALTQLTQGVAAGGGMGGMSQDAQSSLLLDVLQQLTAASMGRPLNSGGTNEGGNRRGLELWSSIPTASQETAVAVSSAYEADEIPTKINLSLPGFREDNGKIFVPPTVRYVEKNMRNENILSREALPVEGYAPFLDVGTRFAYGIDSQAYRHKRIAAIQAVSLTGALRLAATFLSRFPPIPTSKTVFIPSPTADEDTTALQDAGLEIRTFRFLDPKTGSVDWENLRADLQDAPEKSIVLIHVSGSMPSGAELTTNQWRLFATLLQERELIPLVMMAYQGLSTGDTSRDAQALRFMVHEGLPVVLVQSFDAMMGLYADSPAILSIVTQNLEDRDRVDSQLRSVARGMWFHPSPWGAQVAHQILSDAKLYPAWLAEIKAMSDRLRSVREKLFDLLANKLKTPGTWFHLKRASGMYCTALVPPSQVEALTVKRHVHLLPDGCFNLGCLNAPKIDILARAIDSVVRDGIREAEEQQAQRLAMEVALAAAKEVQAREEAEAAAAAEAAEAAAAREEDTLLMERSIANAIEAQKRAEEEETQREQERKVLDEHQKKALERAEIARQAEAILATIS